MEEEKERKEEKMEETQVAHKAGADVQETQKGSKKTLSKKLEDILKSIESLTVLELAGLVSALEEKFGVKALPLAAVGAVAQPGGAAPQAAEEQTTFTVVLSNIGTNKIQVIKVVRELTNLGLKEAKDLVEGAPKPVKEGLPKQEAETIKKKLEEAGAKAELK